MPELFALHTQPPLAHETTLHVPDELQSIVQSPPAHVRLTEPDPLFETLHSPSGQSRLHEPGPLHEKVQPLPVQVYSHDCTPSHSHTVPGAHDRESGFWSDTPLEPPLEPPDDEVVDGVPDDPPDEEVSGVSFLTVQATTRDERAKNETRARIMTGCSAPRVPRDLPGNCAVRRVTDDAIGPSNGRGPRHGWPLVSR